MSLPGLRSFQALVCKYIHMENENKGKQAGRQLMSLSIKSENEFIVSFKIGARIFYIVKSLSFTINS